MLNIDKLSTPQISVRSIRWYQSAITILFKLTYVIGKRLKEPSPIFAPMA
jgi:hypothetical protein